MAKIKRIMGKRGRITIPYEFRDILDIRPNDILTFAITDDKTCVIITKEKICTDCITVLPHDQEITIDGFLARMSKEEKLKALSALSKALVNEE